MKTTLLKKITPVMIFLLGIFGAFGTMSMQKNNKEKPPILGWVHDNMGKPCNQSVSCTDTPTSEFCRVSYEDEDGQDGEIARLKVETVCLTSLYRPN